MYTALLYTVSIIIGPTIRLFLIVILFITLLLCALIILRQFSSNSSLILMRVVRDALPS